MSKPKCPQLIECGDHKMSPFCIICVHLIEGSPRKAFALPASEASPEVDHDWVCEKCVATMGKRGAKAVLDDLRPVCIHCARKVIDRHEKDMSVMEED